MGGPGPTPASQSLIAVSAEPETIRLPRGEKTTEQELADVKKKYLVAVRVGRCHARASLDAS